MPLNEQPAVSIVIPVYAAGERLAQSLERIEQFAQHASYGIELVLVNDGSDEREHNQLFAFARERNGVRYVRHDKNEGKGRSVADGVAVATAPIVVFTDIDVPYDLSVITRMRDDLERDARLSFVVGSRRHRESRMEQSYGLVRSIASRMYTALARIAVDDTFTDVQCGCKAFRRDAARLLFSDLTIRRFAFDAELFLRAKEYGLHYREVPVTFNHNGHSTVRIIPATVRMARDLARLYVRARRVAK